MKSACVGVLSIIELKNARWNTEKPKRAGYSETMVSIYKTTRHHIP